MTNNTTYNPDNHTSNDYLDMDLLRFTTAGSVDDGKSTLIGRLLYDSKAIFQDQLDAIELTSQQRGDGCGGQGGHQHPSGSEPVDQPARRGRGGRGLRAPVLGDRRTAEEIGRAFPGVAVRTSSGAITSVPPIIASAPAPIEISAISRMTSRR